MRIWVDADACPGPIREILFRAARRTGVALVLVANQPLRTPADANITTQQVPPGFDIADDEIVRQLASGDLVVTQDIPLAAAALDSGAHALSPRGEAFTRETIGDRLGMRDFMDTLRGSGVQTGGPPPFGQRDRQNFANALDRLLARRAR